MVNLPEDYDPLKDPHPYMKPEHLAYFRNLLEKELQRLSESNAPKLNEISSLDTTTGDEGDIALNEIQRNVNIRITDRQTKLINKIQRAILRIDSGDYGYCDISGNEIGLKRLMARPMANMTIEEQEKCDGDENIHEKYEESEYLLNEGLPDDED